MKKQKNADTIKITEEMRIPGTDIILEAGDRIRILDEKFTDVTYVFSDPKTGNKNTDGLEAIMKILKKYNSGEDYKFKGNKLSVTSDVAYDKDFVKAVKTYKIFQDD